MLVDYSLSFASGELLFSDSGGRQISNSVFARAVMTP
jgi:hypothetical protein